MSTPDIISVALVACLATGFLAYMFGELSGRVNESRRKEKQETTATYYPFRVGSDVKGYVKVYKSNVLLGDD